MNQHLLQITAQTASRQCPRGGVSVSTDNGKSQTMLCWPEGPKTSSAQNDSASWANQSTWLQRTTDGSETVSTPMYKHVEAVATNPLMRSVVPPKTPTMLPRLQKSGVNAGGGCGCRQKDSPKPQNTAGRSVIVSPRGAAVVRGGFRRSAVIGPRGGVGVIGAPTAIVAAPQRAIVTAPRLLNTTAAVYTAPRAIVTNNANLALATNRTALVTGGVGLNSAIGLTTNTNAVLGTSTLR